MSFQSKLSIAFSLVLTLTIIVAVTSWLGMKNALESQDKLYSFQKHIERVFHEMTLQEQAFTTEETISHSYLVHAQLDEIRKQIQAVDKDEDDPLRHEQFSILLKTINDYEDSFHSYVQQSLNVKTIHSRMDKEVEKVKNRIEKYSDKLEQGKKLFLAAVEAMLAEGHFTQSHHPDLGRLFMSKITNVLDLTQELRNSSVTGEQRLMIFRIETAANSFKRTFQQYADQISILKSARLELKQAFLELQEELSRSIAVESQATSNHIGVLQTLIITTAIFSVFLSIVAILVLSRFITRPINMLKQSAQKIVEGDLNTSVNITSKDEIGELGRLFNHMTQKLQESFQELEKYRDKLEQLVRERTRKLELEINERRETEKELAASENRFRTFFNRASDGILVVNPKTRNFLLANQAICTMLGYEENELNSLCLENIHPEKDLPFILSEFSEMASGRKDLVKDIPVLRKDGTTFPAEITSAAIDIGGQRFILGCVRDISERKAVEEERLKVRKLESVGVLAGGIAHDFNNILAAILGNVSLTIALTDEKDKRYKLLKELEKASLRARSLTQQLLTFSKGGEPIKELASITGIIKESASFILRGSNVRCDYRFAKNLWAVEIDAGQISQVIQNIVVNARQAMPKGGTITVECFNSIPSVNQTANLAGKHCIEIRISDTGEGIPAEDIGKIFDPYFSTKTKGSGLGLAITHSIVVKHGGHITVTSGREAGTTFSILLPAVPTLPPKVSEQVHREANPLTGTVMIMDDEIQVLEIAKHLLEHLGFKTITVHNGEEAITEYKKRLGTDEPVDIVIMDLTIPGGMGGKEAASRILELDRKAKLIVSSGYSQNPIMANFKDYGFRNFLCKPYQMKELREVIQELMDPESLPKI